MFEQLRPHFCLTVIHVVYSRRKQYYVRGMLQSNLGTILLYSMCAVLETWVALRACQPLDAVPVTVAKAFAKAVATTWDTDVATAVELA